jgi:hypothetical protein
MNFRRADDSHELCTPSAAITTGFRNITLALHVATRSRLIPVVASVTTLGSSAVNQEV